MLLSVEGVSLQPRQWDAAAGRVVSHPLAARLNSIITRFRLEIDDKLLELQQCGRLVGMPMAKLREALTGKARGGGRGGGSFYTAFVEFAGSRRAEGTRLVYGQTLRRIVAYVGEEASKGLTFEMINREWLRGFEEFLARTSPSANARGIHLRNIRAVFNHAIDEELTELYPFRRFKIKSQPTRKRSLPVERLRELFALEGLEPHEQRYLDMFKLMFMLCGINIVDLCHLMDVRYGRVEYRRAKTGKVYDIKVEPEAMEIIDRYRGNGQLLDVLDSYGNYRDFAHRLNNNLKYLGGTHLEERVAADGKRRMMAVRRERWPGLSSYWARHTWATVAASLDIPKETIAHALGHSQNSVTDIYIDFDMRKVDEANRRVMDWVLYGKR